MADKHGCHVSAIHADAVYHIRSLSGESVTGHVSASVRNKVRRRDGNVCCYCGDCSNDNSYIVEHVIANVDGGHGRSYNLVMACQSCNVKKGDEVWMPGNFRLLELENPEYANKIRRRAIEPSF